MTETPTWRRRAAVIAADIERAIYRERPDLQLDGPQRKPSGKGLLHALFMCRELQDPDGSIDSDTKACRWLGWLQCICAYEGVTTLEDSKQANLGSRAA